MSGSLVWAMSVPLVAENCQEQPAHLNSRLPATRSYERAPHHGHSNP